MIRNVALATISHEIHVDAILDTGATHCMVPPSMAHLLGFHAGNRLGVETASVIGGQKTADRHCLEYARVGTARAHRVSFLVGELGSSFSIYMLLGLSFIRKFTTTMNFDENRVLFRPREANR